MASDLTREQKLKVLRIGMMRFGLRAADVAEHIGWTKRYTGSVARAFGWYYRVPRGGWWG